MAAGLAFVVSGQSVVAGGVTFGTALAIVAAVALAYYGTRAAVALTRAPAEDSAQDRPLAPPIAPYTPASNFPAPRFGPASVSAIDAIPIALDPNLRMDSMVPAHVPPPSTHDLPVSRPSAPSSAPASFAAPTTLSAPPAPPSASTVAVRPPSAAPPPPPDDDGDGAYMGPFGSHASGGGATTAMRHTPLSLPPPTHGHGPAIPSLLPSEPPIQSDAPPPGDDRDG